MTCQKISIFEHQACEISLKIPNENIGDWLCYGSAIRKGYQECIHFSVEPDTVKNNFKITIPSIDVKSAALKFELYEYQIFLKNINTHQEFLVISGEIEVKKRTCIHDAEGAISDTSIELEAAISETSINVDINIAGGLSAYQIAKLYGYEGSEKEWIAELEGAAAAANSAKKSENDAQLSLAASLEAQDKCEEEARKSENFKNETFVLLQSAETSAQNALDAAVAAQESAVIAEQKKAAAEQSAIDANNAKIASETSENKVKAIEEDTLIAQNAAEKAAADALTAKITAEEQAEIATQAAADAQSPASIAAQAARPATMVLVKDELMSILGDASLFDLDTDGQKIIVYTDRIDDEQLAAVDNMLARYVPQFIEVARYNHHIELTYDEYMKYSKCKSISDIIDVNPEYYNDVTESGVWAYNLDSIGTFTTWVSNEGDWISGLQKSEKVRKVIINAPSYPAYSTNNSCNWFQDMENLEELEFSCKGLAGHVFTNFAKNCLKLKRLKIHIPNAAYIDDTIRNSPLLTYENIEITPNLNEVIRIWGFCSGMDSLKRWTIELPKVNDISWAFSSAGLESFEIGLPSLGSGLGAFAKAILNKESVVRICESLPPDPVTTGLGYSPGNLTLGINEELKHDEAVATAIANAESKGWKINAVFNPATDATNATYSLRKPPIYARLGEKPCEDGTTEHFLVWGHYVTDPTGYEEFGSVEEAREYYGLPDDSLINN